jgi:hypothetical protein
VQSAKLIWCLIFIDTFFIEAIYYLTIYDDYLAKDQAESNYLVSVGKNIPALQLI